MYTRSTTRTLGFQFVDLASSGFVYGETDEWTGWLDLYTLGRMLLEITRPKTAKLIAELREKQYQWEKIEVVRPIDEWAGP